MTDETQTLTERDYSPSLLIHVLCASLRQPDCEPRDGTPCYVCASPVTRGLATDDWAGASFTGQNRVRCPTALYVCEPCIFVMSRVAPVPGRPAKADKKFGGNFRNYSHMWERAWDSPVFGDDDSVRDGYVNASKGEKPLIRLFLRREHAGDWFCAIADSGQKHVIPWVPMNGPGRGGMVLFDEMLIEVPDSFALVDEMTALLTAGATKEEMGNGRYSARTWQLCGGATLRAFENSHAGERHSGWFTLALWLAQRHEETVQRRIDAEKETKTNARRDNKRKMPDAHSRGTPGRKSGIPGHSPGERAEALGLDRDADEERVEDVCDPGRVGYVVEETIADPGHEREQLSLFRRPS